MKARTVWISCLATTFLMGCGGSSVQKVGPWGGFTAPSRVAGASDLYASLAAGDVTGDGEMDLVTIKLPVNEAGVFPGNGDGTFGDRIALGLTMKPRTVAVADVDQDSRMDLIVAGGVGESGEVAIYRSLGNGTFSAPTRIPMEFPVRQITPGDFNRDGLRDFVVLSHVPAPLAVVSFEGDGTGQFVRRHTHFGDVFPTDLAVADFNGDGREDILAAGSEAERVLWLYIGAGDGTFAEPQIFDSLAEPPFGTDGTFCLAAADVTGDGRADAVTGHNINYEMAAMRPTVVSNTGVVSFGAANRILMGGPFDIAVVDLNRDGRQDIMASNHAYSDVSYVLNRAGGNFDAPIAIGVDALPAAMVFADFDGDSFPDLAVTSGLEIGVEILLNRGNR